MLPVFRVSVLSVVLGVSACSPFAPDAVETADPPAPRRTEPLGQQHPGAPPSWVSAGGTSTTSPAGMAGSPPAIVVELFTSEGCSSCPPADIQLAKLAREAPAGVQLIPLEFHVDYWDSLGWTDPFASAQWTRRQGVYANKFGTGMYTPQMVVQGSNELVGGRGDEARRRVIEAQKEAQSVRLQLRLDEPRSGRSPTSPTSHEAGAPMVVHITAERVPADALVQVLLVERGLTSKVRRGENAGSTLHHEGVVRWMRSVSASAPEIAPGSSGALTMDVPIEGIERVKRENSSVVVFLQRSSSLRIEGAAQQPL